MARILALGVLLGGITSVADTRTAAAHVCTNPVEVKVGRLFSVNIGVAAEDKPVTQVEITVPKGFEMEDQFGFLGWVGERRGDVVYYSGSRIEPYQCGFFTFKGSLPRKGIYVARITVTADDGTRRVYKNTNPYSAFPAMTLYAGVEIPPPDEFTGGGDGGNSLVQSLGVGVAAGALAVGVAWKVNQRRARP